MGAGSWCAQKQEMVDLLFPKLRYFHQKSTYKGINDDEIGQMKHRIYTTLSANTPNGSNYHTTPQEPEIINCTVLKQTQRFQHELKSFSTDTKNTSLPAMNPQQIKENIRTIGGYVVHVLCAGAAYRNISNLFH